VKKAGTATSVERRRSEPDALLSACFCMFIRMPLCVCNDTACQCKSLVSRCVQHGVHISISDYVEEYTGFSYADRWTDVLKVYLIFAAFRLSATMGLRFFKIRAK
jgi:hypothetical protein